MQPAELGARYFSIRRAALQGMLVVTLSGVPVGIPACRAQTVVETPQQTNERIQALSLAVQKLDREYVIGPGDLVSVEVFDVPELSRDVRVGHTGTIALPLLPVRLHVAGLTEMQTAQKIAEVLEANGLVTRPNVSVSVKEKRSKPIMVIGAVNHPLVYHADHTVTLLEVLSEAGGIANDAAGMLIVTRVPAEPPSKGLEGPLLPEAPKDSAPPATAPQPLSSPAPPAAAKPGNALPAAEEGTQKAAPPATSFPSAADEPEARKDVTEPPPLQITINLGELLETGDPKSNIVLQAGDIVTVPHAGTVYAIGAVQRPGGFVLTNDRSQMTALKLMSLSGGLTRVAKADRAVIVRKDGTGQQTQVPVNLKKILKREQEDVQLQASDILFVPESSGRQAAIRLAEIALAVGTAVAIYRVAYH